MDIFLVLFVILAISCVTGLITMQVFFLRLKSQHYSVWVDLGRPVIFLNSGFLNTIGFMRYMWRKSYLDLGDERTTRIGTFLRSLLIFYFALIALVMLSVPLTVALH